MDGDIMYMLIYREPDKELRYLEFDFNSAIAKSTLIAEDVEMKPFLSFMAATVKFKMGSLSTNRTQSSTRSASRTLLARLIRAN